MPANSLARNIFKRVVFPLVPESVYSFFQAVSKAWDIRNGSWYEPELDLIPYALLSGEAALDVGANFGLYSYHLGRTVDPRGKVYAFEPIPFTSKTLAMVARILRFRNVIVVPKGCGEQSGTITFKVPVADAGSFSTGQAYVADRLDDRPGKEIQVRWKGTRDLTAEVVVLDEYLKESRPVRLIKCDVEGFELPVFRGARRLIQRDHPTVICEIVPWFLEGFHFSLAELIAFFTDQGYELFRYVGERRQGRLQPTRTEDVVEDNYVFIHPDHRSRFLPLIKD